MLEASSTPSSEEKAIDELIIATERQLKTQKILKELITRFSHQREQFEQGNQSKALVSEMVKTASSILEILQENRYHDLLPPPYIEDLKFMDNIRHKSRPTLP